ncbi:hypothetical protein DFH06DRAFT_1333694 [Mycena polygramma]|nr:hypothetical protein DFH06DRAFT_1333694 [Mycena polygramma]
MAACLPQCTAQQQNEEQDTRSHQKRSRHNNTFRTLSTKLEGRDNALWDRLALASASLVEFTDLRSSSILNFSSKKIIGLSSPCRSGHSYDGPDRPIVPFSAPRIASSSYLLPPRRSLLQFRQLARFALNILVSCVSIDAQGAAVPFPIASLLRLSRIDDFIAAAYVTAESSLWGFGILRCAWERHLEGVGVGVVVSYDRRGLGSAVYRPYALGPNDTLRTGLHSLCTKLSISGDPG